MDGDIELDQKRSTWGLSENGLMIGVPHVRHDTIRRIGRGLFSLWGNKLYFSASDNTDPNRNGRRYTLVPLPTEVAAKQIS